MPYPHDVLASVAFPAVTNIRASGDYDPSHTNWDRDRQWAIAATGLLYWGLGKVPYRPLPRPQRVPTDLLDECGQPGGGRLAPRTSPRPPKSV